MAYPLTHDSDTINMAGQKSTEGLSFTTELQTPEPIPQETLPLPLPPPYDHSNIPISASLSFQTQCMVESTPKVTAVDYSLKLDPSKQLREYQKELAAPGIEGKNYIIVAPTGCGKTLIAGIIISNFLENRTDLGKKVFFMVDKKPLAQQQTKELAELIPGATVTCCTGEPRTLKIKDVLQSSDIIVCTSGKLLEELKCSRKQVNFNKIGLLVMDECHHARKKSSEAKVMKRLLRKKHKLARKGSTNEEEEGSIETLPQVIGLTASPGAGENPDLDMPKTLDHLLALCALLDATDGIKIVQDHKQELDQFTNKATNNLDIIKRRTTSDPIISSITKEMMKLEQRCDIIISFPRWSQEYEAEIIKRKQALEISLEEHRNEISTLNLMRCYSQALNTYMDLRYEDTVGELRDYPRGPHANLYERELLDSLDKLIENLATLPRIANPLLQRVEAILDDKFEGRSDARGIFFVRTKKHALAICRWISELASAQRLGICPRMITGHTHETEHGMTQVEQKDVLETFREGKCNILVATSVAEEGLDVPACNLVIRFQHVSNEIAKTQTIGRARAEESEAFTILSSDSKKTMQEIKNDELLALVDLVLENGYIPGPKLLRSTLFEQQQSILEQDKVMRQLKKQSSKKDIAHKVKLSCKKCKTLACYGSEVRTTQESTGQYIVTNKDFIQKIAIRPHHNPMTLDSGMKKNHKIYCCKCDEAWGVYCTWPEKGAEFPVLKCKSFVFSINEIPFAVKKWSEAPFKIPGIIFRANQIDSDSESSSGGDSDEDLQCTD